LGSYFLNRYPSWGLIHWFLKRKERKNADLRRILFGPILILSWLDSYKLPFKREVIPRQSFYGPGSRIMFSQSSSGTFSRDWALPLVERDAEIKWWSRNECCEEATKRIPVFSELLRRDK